MKIQVIKKTFCKTDEIYCGNGRNYIFLRVHRFTEAVQIEFFNASELKQGLTATVHHTGRLGFGRTVEKKLNLPGVKSVMIGRGRNYETDGVLYLVTDNAVKPGSFVVRKSGQYFYAHTRHLFEMLKEDFKNSKIIYDISADTVDGQQVFKLKPRTIERKRR